jgi:hypothetical protein
LLRETAMATGVYPSAMGRPGTAFSVPEDSEYPLNDPVTEFNEPAVVFAT